MVVIRLTRVGKKNSPAYRVVVADKQRAVKRKFIEVIGHYNPTRTPKEIVIDKDRALFWLGKGAMPSDTVRNLMADLEIIKKSEKAKIVYGREKKKKEMKEAAEGKKPVAETQAEENSEGTAEETQAPAEETPETKEEPAGDNTEGPAAEENSAKTESAEVKDQESAKKPEEIKEQ